jgi:hypothetical protein
VKPIRNLLSDLVERRLWPVALLLVAAAVAVPVYLGRSSDDGATDAGSPAATAQAGPKASKAAVKLDETADESDGAGRVNNPFKQKHLPKADKAATDAATTDKAATSGGSSSPAASSGSGGSSPSTGADTGSGGSGGSGTTGTQPAPAKKTVDISQVSLHLGPVGDLKTYKDLARLSPLPSVNNPLFVFTGVLKDGKTVVLLPASTIQLSEESDVTCKPSNKNCQKIELRDDDTVFFTILGDTSGTQYQLDVVSVRVKGSTVSAKAAAAALQRHSKAGAAALRDAHVYNRGDFAGVSDYRFLPETGLLTRVPKHGKARAAVNGATAASADDAAAALPGLPVWHWRDDS